MPGVKLRRNQINLIHIFPAMLEGKNKQVQNRSKYLAKPMCESRDFFNLFSLKNALVNAWK